MSNLTPFALRDTPALIERIFPAQKISAEAQKERKAGAGQTLTALGSYWKGRKPLIMVRAIVLGCLLPVTEDLEADLQIFEQLMAIADESFSRREPKLKVAELAERIRLENPWDFFDYILPKGKNLPLFEGGDNEDNIANLTFPLQIPLKVRWKRGLPDAEKQKIYGLALEGLTYEEKVNLCKRPEELDPEMLYGPIWPAVNAHLGRFGISAQSHQELVEQLGILRFGHRPKVGDTFCGGGSIPFEAARLGCDVYASDLNPVACMLTWGALNIIGASPERRAEIEQAQREVAEAVDQEIVTLGIEHNERGDRAKAYLYCLETHCPETGWLVPMSPSWAVSKRHNVYAKLIPNPQEKRFEIEIITGASQEEMETAEKGTVQDGNLIYELDEKVYQTSIKTIRGDYKDQDKVNRNKLRQWEKSDFKPRPDDIFQERLYCIQWIAKETLGKSTLDTYFAAVTAWDLANEKKVEDIVGKSLRTWQDKGLVPDMEIEAGAKTDEPIRTRGWRYWHHLFNPRNILLISNLKKISKESIHFLGIARCLDYNNKLTRWFTGSRTDGGSDFTTNMFSNQALNTLINWGCRGSLDGIEPFTRKTVTIKNKILNNHSVFVLDVKSLSIRNDIFITDPPYADAVNYEEILSTGQKA
jgi:putative DNA methylase